jgi:hypothetical protein
MSNLLSRRVLPILGTSAALVSLCAGAATAATETEPAARAAAAEVPSAPVHLAPGFTGVQQVNGWPQYAGVQSKEAGEALKMYDPGKTQYGQWTFKKVHEGQYQLVNSGTDKCLDVRDGSTADNAPVIQWDCKDAADSTVANQLWTWNGQQLTNVKSGKMLAQTSSQANSPILQTSNDNAFTWWQLLP